MAGRTLLMSLVRRNLVNGVRSYSNDAPPINVKYGNREVVGFGLNGEASYLDLEDFPYPAIRYKEITPDIQALKEKEKGDWKKLSTNEKKELYRASFCQTFAEIDAPTGEWKSITGCAAFGIGIALWIFILLKTYVYPPLPHTFSREWQLATYDRLVKLDANPIWGDWKRKEK
ncbi:hypothetical protein HCN44_007258 [Aphidius gifuensis]|uniref:Cytochrome c oxidase subunit 4 n=1 Tax=Aphidius gifuensis TaxID=684658 RepID=A0A834XKM8_APHGI|nr:cytochrome c oxidase subunit 4 isoform 1, mitochondrial-like [Aphidius gifuensis]KAF7988948.1 hypothetical protein HCN44_007258 [Aphidius gifuensis]